MVNNSMNERQKNRPHRVVRNESTRTSWRAIKIQETRKGYENIIESEINNKTTKHNRIMRAT